MRTRSRKLFGEWLAAAAAVTLAICFSATEASSDEINHQTESFLTSRARKWSESPTAENNQDLFFYLRHELSITKEAHHAVVTPYLLLSHSQKLEQSSQDPLITPIFTEKRQLDIDHEWSDDRRTWAVFDFQEAAYEYRKNDFAIEAGRRILSLGNLKLFSVWNKFNPTALSLRPTWMNGVDQAKLAWQHNNTKVIGYSIFDQDKSDRAQLAIVEHFKSPYQFNFLGGEWWHSTALGFSSTADISGWLIKLETLHLDYHDELSARDSEWQTAIGFEHGFLQDWVVNVEMLTQSEGARDEDEYSTFVLSPHQSFRGERLLASELKWTPDPFYNLSALAAVSLVDHSRLFGLGAAYQYSDQIEISLGLMSPQGEGELGPKMKFYPSANVVGVPAQADLTVKAFF